MKTVSSYPFLFALIFLCVNGVFSQPGSISEFIKVDQFGYRPGDDKVAVISDPIIGYNASSSYVPGANFEVRSSGTNTLVHIGIIQQWNGGATHSQSGDKGWWYDFSTLNIAGSYYVYDPVNDTRSFEFEISSDIYDPILKATGKMFYYNRCGMSKSLPYADANWVDGNNFTQDLAARFIEDPNNASLFKDVSGGWFDAGDYNKYVNYTNSTLHNLLWAYQQAPDVFTDYWNIPESGNGVPDILDEIKWEVDWLLKMVNPDGTVHIKVGSNSYSENEEAPPSINNDPRYYGPTCTSSEITTAGILAHAAIVFSEFPSLQPYAFNLENQAINIWSQVVLRLNAGTLDFDCDDLSINSSDSDEDEVVQRSNAVSAAIYLLTLTGDPIYNSYIVANNNDSKPIGLGLYDNYHLPEIDALMLYTTLPIANSTLINNITSTFSDHIAGNWNSYFGWTDNDLYRAHMPDWTYHWGSNSPKAAFGVLNYVAELYNLDNTVDFEKRYEETLHYFHGVNPLNKCYLSNMYEFGAENPVNEVYHTWFNNGTLWDNALNEIGPAPGFLAGGPNVNYDVNTSLTPPYNQPAQKSYLDFNDAEDFESWQITEPGIYYQAVYLRLLSQMVELSDPGISLHLKTFLEGPYDETNNIMKDDLRQNGFLPAVEPFTNLGFTHVGGGEEETISTVLNVTGNNAIVDWIFVELRSGANPTSVLATKSALVQRDGDIVDVDGISFLEFENINEDQIFVALRHRNHFGIRTDNSYSTSSLINIDFTLNSTELYGNSPTNLLGNVRVMISGDANRDGQINSIDKNIYWRVQNGNPFNYINSTADFDINVFINSIDKNIYFRTNNSKVEQLD